jgi:hypothetical protein
MMLPTGTDLALRDFGDLGKVFDMINKIDRMEWVIPFITHSCKSC